MQSLLYLVSQLPKPAQKQVHDFVEFLLGKYQKKNSTQATNLEFPLKNSVLKYEGPFDPVAADDWEAYS